MSKFFVVPKNGKFSIENETEVLGEVHDRALAESICQQLNYEPGKNPCETFYNAGRWTCKGKEEAA